MNNTDELRLQCQLLCELLTRKNKDYGDSMFVPSQFKGVSPELACYVRMGDKINRLKNLLSGEEEASVSESIDDTLLDLAGYCLAARVIRNATQANKDN